MDGGGPPSVIGKLGAQCCAVENGTQPCSVVYGKGAGVLVVLAAGTVVSFSAGAVVPTRVTHVWGYWRCCLASCESCLAY